MLVTIKYGSGNELKKEFPSGTTIGQIIRNPSVQGALGYGNNVEGFVQGCPQHDNTQAADSMAISVHEKACGKASWAG